MLRASKGKYKQTWAAAILDVSCVAPDTMLCLENDRTAELLDLQKQPSSHIEAGGMSMLMLCTQWMFRVSNHVPKYHAHWENIHALGTRMYPSCKQTSKHAMNRWQSQFPKWSTYVCFIEATQPILGSVTKNWGPSHWRVSSLSILRTINICVLIRTTSFDVNGCRC